MLETRGLTAINRVHLSRPVALALNDGIVRADRSFFDFGCGHGTDVAALVAMGIHASGWDPVHHPDAERSLADVVNLGYVVNVIEDPQERRETLRQAWQLSSKVLVLAARLDWDIKAEQAVPFSDGVITAKGTFQKFFSQDELQRWVEECLGVQADAAAPGVFYVFRHATDREAHLARAPHRRLAAPAVPPSVTLDRNRDVLEPLLQFIVEHGRPPASGELSAESVIAERIGSLHRAVRVLSRVVDLRSWEDAALARQRDLLVYLALGLLRRQPKFSVLPKGLQIDIRHFFGSYAAALRLGRELLFSGGQQEALSEECSNAILGKLLPDALYVHVSALSELPVLLRVYEGCARTLLGDVDGATIVKLRRDKPQVSYLCYPHFDDDAHPALREAFVVDLRALRTNHRNYTQTDNPPLLHRKESFVPDGYPRRQEFAALTLAEEEAGLLSDPKAIGTVRAWQERLAAAGLSVVDHRLLRSRTTGRTSDC